MWRGCLGLAYLFPALSSAGASLARPCPVSTSTGWPEAVAHPRLPQNVACGFAALRSSDVGSQYGEILQLPVGEIQLWPQQRKLISDPIELLPPDLAFPTPTAQHLSPVMPYSTVDT